MSENEGLGYSPAKMSQSPGLGRVLKDSNRANLPGTSPALKPSDPVMGISKVTPGSRSRKEEAEQCQEDPSILMKQDRETYTSMAGDVLDQLALTLPLPPSPSRTEKTPPDAAPKESLPDQDRNSFQARSSVVNSLLGSSSSGSSESEVFSDDAKENDDASSMAHVKSSSSQAGEERSQGEVTPDTGDLGELDDMLSALASLSLAERARRTPAKNSFSVSHQPRPPASSDAAPLITQPPPSACPAEETGESRVKESDATMKVDDPTEETKTSAAEESAQQSASLSCHGDQNLEEDDLFKSGPQIPHSLALCEELVDEDDSEVSFSIPLEVDQTTLLPRPSAHSEVSASDAETNLPNDASKQSVQIPDLASEMKKEAAVLVDGPDLKVSHLDHVVEEDPAKDAVCRNPVSAEQGSVDASHADASHMDASCVEGHAEGSQPALAPGEQSQMVSSSLSSNPMEPEIPLPNLPAPEEDPFKPKAQLSNSPVVEKDPFKPKAQLSNSPVVEEDPLKPKAQLQNSPVAEVDPFKPKAQLQNSSAPKEDPFKPKAQVQNSLVVEEDPFKPKAQLQNSPAPEVDPFKPKAQLSNSPVVEKDPFKPKAQLQNSPVVEKDPLKPKAQLQNSPVVEEDPFKPKAQLPNSPVVEEDPFKPKAQLQNSPVVEKDPFKSKAQLPNSPAPEVDKAQLQNPVVEVDPFKPKAQLQNSPVVEEDPFKPKAQLQNSPAPEVDPLKPKAQLQNSPVVEKDPFKPKAQLPNSPVVEEDPFKPKAQLQNSPAPEVDSFKPKAQLQNSPVVEKDPFKPKAQLQNSPVVEKDPFKPKAQLQNSPVVEKDPFKPKAQLPNSPVVEEDPFKPKAQLQNSPAPEVDSFKPKAQLQNYPVVEKDPFKPKAQLQNSPGVEKDPFKPKAQLQNSVVEEDPFKPKAQLQNSPVVEEDPFKPKAQLQNSPVSSMGESAGSKKGLSGSVAASSTLPLSGLSQAAEMLGRKQESGGNAGGDLMAPFTPLVSSAASKTTQTRVKTETDRLLGSPMPGEDNPLVQQGLLFRAQQLSMSDDGFRPATEVFQDPFAWDVLEKFGESGKENDLARMSLYVKFDPLVKAVLPASSPKPDSMRPVAGKPADLNRDQSMVQEESILLMGTPPRRTKRHSLLTHRRGNANVSVVQHQAIQEEQMMDQIFSCSSPSIAPQTQSFTSGVPISTGATDLAPVLAYSEDDWVRMKSSLEMAHRGELMKREEAWSREKESLQTEKAKLQKTATKAKQDVSDLACLIPEYEKIIDSLTAEKKKITDACKEKVDTLTKERDSALEDVQSLETAFSELQKRYEKLRGIIDGFKKNEEILKKVAASDREKLKTAEENYKRLKKSAEEKLTKLNEELQQVHTSSTSEAARLEATLRRKDLQIQSQEKSLQQKDVEIQELTQICDSLISKVSS